jgi:ADP-ribose pyrophosphatase YjhB (NUDIX family)
MPPVRDQHCSACGAAFPATAGYPKTCAACGFMVWANPIPVSVVLVPVAQGGRTGLLVVTRGIEPGRGRLALVGGFLEDLETWQQGGAREVLEETGVRVDPATLEPFWYTSTAPRPNRVLLFSVAETRTAASLEPFVPSSETASRGLVFGPEGLEAVFVFPLHVEAARRFFAARGLTGPHDHITV